MTIQNGFIKMRYTLFHLDGERGFRGGERQLLYLASHLRERGHENIVVCRRGEPLDREARSSGLRVLNLPFLGEWDVVSALRLRRAVSRERAPILHAHTAHTAALARLASLFGGPPWVVHRRVDFHLRGDLSRALKYSPADRVVAVSKAIRRILIADGVAADRVAVIPDCLPTTEPEAQAAGLTQGPLRPPRPEQRRTVRADIGKTLGIDPEALWIGNLAAWVPHKDHETLIRAAALVRKQFPKVRFLLIGGGPLQAALKTLCEELGLGSNVVFLGRQSDTRPWLHALDLYVQSSWGEGMGSILLEAMAAGLPIVATTAGGIPEVVEDAKTALLVPPRSPEALAASILAVARDRSSAAKRAKAAREAIGRFSLSSVGAKTEELYADVRRGAGLNGVGS